MTAIGISSVAAECAAAETVKSSEIFFPIT